MQAPAPPEGYVSGLAALYSQNAGPRLSKKAFRSVPQAPERILDAPDMLDDYYLNLLDWGSNNVVRGPGLAACMRFVQCIQSSMHTCLTDTARGASALLSLSRAVCCTQVAVALGAAVYLWNAGSGSIEQLMECAAEDDYVTSVAWAADGKHIAVGTSSAAVQIWDAGRSRQVRALRGHSARVSALSWSGTTLSTAGRDTLVLNHDVRCGSL